MFVLCFSSTVLLELSIDSPESSDLTPRSLSPTIADCGCDVARCLLSVPTPSHSASTSLSSSASSSHPSSTTSSSTPSLPSYLYALIQSVAQSDGEKIAISTREAIHRFSHTASSGETGRVVFDAMWNLLEETLEEDMKTFPSEVWEIVKVNLLK